MKKHIYILIIVFASIFTACEPDMDLVNPNELTVESYYQTPEELTAGVNGVYNILQRSGGWGRYMQYALNGKGDDFSFTNKASAGMKEIPALCNYTMEADNRVALRVYQAMYVMEYASNLILEKIDAATMVKDEVLKDRLRGEALFLRGLSHFYLASFFGEEIPYRNAIPKSESDFFGAPLAKGEMYGKIVADFEKAIELLPLRAAMYAQPENVGRATKGSAQAFLAKTYLMKPILLEGSQADWTAAAHVLKDIIDSKQYELMTNFRHNHIETTENNKESIFEVQFFNNLNGEFGEYAAGEDIKTDWLTTDQSTWREQEMGMMDASGDNSTWWNMAPTPRAMNEFERSNNADLTSPIADPRYSMSIWGPGGAKYDVLNDPTLSRFRSYEQIITVLSNRGKLFGTRKYCADKASAPWESGINDRLIRYSDVLLMYAECLVELNRPTEAVPFINDVRKRANNKLTLTTGADSFLFYATAPATLPMVETLITSAPTINGMQINTLRRAIKHERFVELFAEGWRFFDLLRWSKNTNDPDAAIVLDPLKNKFPDTGYAYKVGKNEYFPIPAEELAINKNMKPNSAN
ncbi:MAG: RagB/SusD family nutrient uptake outer membrane protein [Paludibacter sp.]|nr:RagB/SusD family nutrient uptake outer membrane protein [Paludibacter sp.]